MQLMFMTSQNMFSSNNFIYTFENIILVLYFVSFNCSRVTLITGHLQKNDQRKHSKTLVLNTPRQAPD